jgi:hypothetical protein
MTPGDPTASCAHVDVHEGRCRHCGTCIHDVVLNGKCFWCGSTDLDPVRMSPRPELVPTSRLKRR